MLYDLNISWTPQTSSADLERTLKFSHSLGYNVAALNHTFGQPIPPHFSNPMPKLGPLHPSFPQHNRSSSSTPTTTTTTTTNNNNNSVSSTPSDKLPTTLRRATVLISDTATHHHLPTLAAAYDILACRPTTDKAFSAACTTMDHISLISLDLTTSFPFHFKPKPCMAAVNRGVYFEICYGQLVDNTDQHARSVWISNVTALVRATRGRGIVLSSGGKGGPGGLRAPADVVNLLAVWGLGQEKGLEGLGVNARAVVVNEGLKRRGFRGVVDIVDAEGSIPRGEGNGGANGKKDGGNQKKDKNGKKQQGGNGNGKRKHDGGGDHRASGDEISLAVMSKRQAKKTKLAEKRTAADSPTETTK